MLLLWLMFAFSAARAQYGNEWIEYNLTYYKIKVTKTGLYRIPYSTLSQVQGANLPVQGSTVNIFCMGKAVPFYVTSTGTLGQNDFIEFLGAPNDGTLDRQLYAAPDTQQLNPYYSMFNDTAVYFLTWNSVSPKTILTNTTNDLTNLPSKELYFMNTVREVYKDSFQYGKSTYITGNPIYESVYDEGEGYASFPFNKSEGSSVITASQIYFAAPVGATLRTNLVSFSQTPHELTFGINGYSLGSVSFNKFQLNTYSFPVEVNKLTQYNTFTVLAHGSGTTDRNAMSFLEITYPREFIFANESKVKFTLNAGANARYLEISAFNDKGTVPVLYDFSNGLRLTGTQGANPLKFKLPSQSGNTKRELYLSSQHSSDITTVTKTDLEQGKTVFTNYFNPSYQGDYVILTHPKLRTGSDYVGEYANYRKSAQGGSHEVEVVLITQLYDQFGYGIQKHPIAIRNFISFALDNWTVKPEHLFIIGKGREYNVYRKSGAAYNQCLIPTYGNPGADNLLTATATSITPRVAVGRLSVENPSDINVYLEKVKGFERIQQERGDPHQTIDNKAWMKRIMHMGGGTTSSEQAIFKQYLNNFEETIEDTLFGANVYSFFKTSPDPIQFVQTDFIKELISTGVSLMTFFGHSSPGSFDISIDHAEDFNNFERYPLILSNGCYTGNIYNSSQGISEQYVLAPAEGAIGFISTISYSSSAGLNTFSGYFYQNLGSSHYGTSIGNLMRLSVQDVEAYKADAINKSIAEEMTLHGDPALTLNPQPLPDYVIEPQNVSFEPAVVSANQESFQIKAIVVNIGKAISDSIDVVVTRQFPNPDDGTLQYTKRIKGVNFMDTVYFEIPTGSTKAFGINDFHIKIDNADAVDELSETNNELGGIVLNITSEDVFPTYPYDFAIVPSGAITLKASTANTFAPLKTYRMEIDTSELFDSPVKLSTAISQQGGVLSWIPAMNYVNNTVYYWRVGVDITPNDGSTSWHNSSFTYIEDENSGWNQSHYFQYQKNKYNTVYLDSSREFKFIGDTRTVSVKTGTATFYGGSIIDDQIAYHLNSGLKHRWNCGGSGGFDNGIVLAVFDSITGNNWISNYPDDIQAGEPCSGYQYNTRYGNIHCKNRDAEGFDFPTTSGCWQDKIVTFLDNVPDGSYILAYSVNNAGYSGWGPNLVDAFLTLGSKMIDTLSNTSGSSGVPWAFFAQKGNPNSASEKRGVNKWSILDFTAVFDASWNQGTMTTPTIGPATKWSSVQWNYHTMEPQSSDLQSVDIIGITPNGMEVALDSNITDAQHDIQHIDASVYPYLKLHLDTQDDSTRTPAQLDYWRVLYKKAPEAALHPTAHLDFKGDTITLGDELSLSIAIENVTETLMDSLLVKYTLQSSGLSPASEFVRFDSLGAFETMNLDWLFNTDCNCLGEVNTLIIEANPVPQGSSGSSYDQLEQFHFNNIGVLTFKADKDRINPLLDVTFDGVHIMDGDVVSAQPEILIRLNDENRYMLLNDTSLVNVVIVSPDGEQTRIPYDGNVMRFEEATGTDNTAHVRLKREFEQNGTYALLVQAKDRSRNISGTYGLPEDGVDYRVSFEVIREARITNVLNYPNPFTTSTRFVFMLTGVQTPDFFKIQIMTISGKIVRELTEADLGPIHVGKNITEFAWDGTDEFGAPLANGLYLYHVVATIDGEAIEAMEQSYDKYFKSGFGKMYLAR